jgi:uncharacterized membrane protein YkvA (DUF1232 family)
MLTAFSMTTFKQNCQATARRVLRELAVYRRVLKHPRTPWLARVLLGAAVAYAVSPVDLIPDFIPVLGYVDDLLLVPGLIRLAVLLIPKDVITECRAAVLAMEESNQRSAVSDQPSGEI